MTCSASIAHHIANVVMGVIYAGALAALIGWIWPGMGWVAFISFLVGWALDTISTRALERRHPEILAPSRWATYSRLRELQGEKTLSEILLGQLALISFGMPVALLIAGVIGLVWSPGKWLAFSIIFAFWAILMVMLTAWAISRKNEYPGKEKECG